VREILEGDYGGEKGLFELIEGEVIISRPGYSKTFEGVETKGRNWRVRRRNFSSSNVLAKLKN